MTPATFARPKPPVLHASREGFAAGGRDLAVTDGFILPPERKLRARTIDFR